MAINKIIDKIHQRYVAASNRKRPFIVALDGLSGAGKTTTANALKQGLIKRHYNVVVFHIDDYIVERERRYHTCQEEWYEYYSLQWDIEGLSKNLFEKLHNQCHNLCLPFYDEASDTVSPVQKSVPINSIVMIEGVFLQRKAWRNFYDYCIYMECSRELRFRRVLERDTYIGDYQARLSKYKRRYWPAEDHYLEKEKPAMIADVVYQVKDNVD